MRNEIICCFMFCVSAVFCVVYTNHKEASERTIIRSDSNYQISSKIDRKQKIFDKLLECYTVADKNYDITWANYCKNINEENVSECISKNMSRQTCENNFKFKPNCALPTIKANNANESHTSSKHQCEKLFTLEMMVVQ